MLKTIPKEQLENHIAELNQKHALAIQKLEQDKQKLEQTNHELATRVNELTQVEYVKKRDSQGRFTPLKNEKGLPIFDKNNKPMFEMEAKYASPVQQKIHELEQEIQDLKAKLQQSKTQNQTHQLQQPKPTSQAHNTQWEDYYKPKKGRGRR
ncbi:hypothetical protein [Helicobacter bizzozeronii]|uniref:hypothetical protein n=1 Tax=Helicobacter bizzozeronii TaxID=56877 RepID=UPI000CF11368|nr:hypothetical protein [Helicobacter bizzozeronii]